MAAIKKDTDPNSPPPTEEMRSGARVEGTPPHHLPEMREGARIEQGDTPQFQNPEQAAAHAVNPQIGPHGARPTGGRRAKPPGPGQKTYRVWRHGKLAHNGVDYLPGEPVNLSEDDAAPLLEQKVVALPNDWQTQNEDTES